MTIDVCNNEQHTNRKHDEEKIKEKYKFQIIIKKLESKSCSPIGILEILFHYIILKRINAYVKCESYGFSVLNTFLCLDVIKFKAIIAYL